MDIETLAGSGPLSSSSALRTARPRIYVGQTREKLSGRVGRHLTNQRTDAVAMRVLDPLEVAAVEVWPLWDFDEIARRATT